MHVAELWRYPVKSPAGERLERALLGDISQGGWVSGDLFIEPDGAMFAFGVS
jgi:uncharacterized protein YcbX